MTEEKVKKELRKLRSIIIVEQAGLKAEDPNGLIHKYEKAAKRLDPLNQTIYTEKIVNGKTYKQIGLSFHYSKEWVRKKWKKIISTLAELL